MVRMILPVETCNAAARVSTRNTSTKKSKASSVQPRKLAVTACHWSECVSANWPDGGAEREAASLIGPEVGLPEIIMGGLARSSEFADAHQNTNLAHKQTPWLCGVRPVPVVVGAAFMRPPPPKILGSLSDDRVHPAPGAANLRWVLAGRRDGLKTFAQWPVGGVRNTPKSLVQIDLATNSGTAWRSIPW